MKRIISIALLISLCLSAFILVGCSKGEKTGIEMYDKYIVTGSKRIRNIEVAYYEGSLSSTMNFPKSSEKSPKIDRVADKLASENLQFKLLKGEVPFMLENVLFTFNKGTDEEYSIMVYQDGYVYIYDIAENGAKLYYVSTTTVNKQDYMDIYKNW